MPNPMRWLLGWALVLAMVLPGQAAEKQLRMKASPAMETRAAPATQAQKLMVHPAPGPSGPTTGIRTVTGFDFSTTATPGTTGIRTVSGFDFSTQATPGTTGIRTVAGFDFSTQATPGTTGIRTVTGFDFTKQ